MMKKPVKTFLLAIGTAILMVLFTAFPPLSIPYQWLVSNGLWLIWIGVTAGVVGLVVTLYQQKHR